MDINEQIVLWGKKENVSLCTGMGLFMVTFLKNVRFTLTSALLSIFFSIYSNHIHPLESDSTSSGWRIFSLVLLRLLFLVNSQTISCLNHTQLNHLWYIYLFFLTIHAFAFSWQQNVSSLGAMLMATFLFNMVKYIKHKIYHFNNFFKCIVQWH